MASEKQFNDQVGRFHREIVELVKKYQFRDRNQIVCCGVSVSQCYVLETIQNSGPMTMNHLARRMQLSVSTVTRVVEQLVKKRLVLREKDPQDRRFHSIRLTEKGRNMYRRSWQNVIESERIILRHFPAEHRSMLIDLLAKLNLAVENWQCGCCRTKNQK